VNRKPRLALLLGLLVLPQTAAWAADPLAENLKRLEGRAQPRTVPATRRPRKALVRRSRPAPRAHRVARESPPPATLRNDCSLAYSEDRIGAKERGGDLFVATSGGKGAVHVYLRQRLISNGGNGQARVPDVAPGKHPVMVWAVGAGKRKTYWVTVRPGTVASLKVTL
jgi:hypothetical protein